MTTSDLARDYFKRSLMRFKALKVLLNEGAYPDVIRESQEIMELLLKGYLRLKLIDPPKWHDVGGILADNKDILSAEILSNLEKIVEFSKYLRRERENAFYGEDDLIPLEHYDFQMAKSCYNNLEDIIKIFAPEFK
ncbi:MAG: HEPN domain-containing protein [Pseudobdellovibrionaceae bacterium]